MVDFEAPPDERGMWFDAVDGVEDVGQPVTLCRAPTGEPWCVGYVAQLAPDGGYARVTLFA